MTEQVEAARAEPSGSWRRALLMVAFGFAGYLALWGVFVLAALQFVFALVDGAPNPQLRRFSRGLGAWLGEIVAFLTYGSETRPFPFAPFPASGEPDAPPPAP